MMRRRNVRMPAAMAVVLMLAAACGTDAKDDASEVRAAVAATLSLPRRIVYDEHHDGRTVGVDVFVEDDFRYKAQVSFDGVAVYEERVVDDALAVRLLRPEGASLLAPGVGGDDDGTVELLASGAWVVDATGAPDHLASVRTSGGTDPVADALNVLRWLDAVVLDEQSVVEFSEFDVGYDPNEDPFDVPEASSATRRYDVRPLPLPKVRSEGGDQIVPSETNFRRLAVYIEDGLVTRVEGITDVASRLDTLSERYGFDFEGAAGSEAAALALGSINAVRTRQGDEPIRARDVSVVVTGVPDGTTIEMPSGEGVAKGDLEAFRSPPSGRSARAVGD